MCRDAHPSQSSTAKSQAVVLDIPVRSQPFHSQLQRVNSSVLSTQCRCSVLEPKAACLHSPLHPAPTHSQWFDDPGHACNTCQHGHLCWVQVQIILEEKGQGQTGQPQDALHKVYWGVQRAWRSCHEHNLLSLSIDIMQAAAVAAVAIDARAAGGAACCCCECATPCHCILGRILALTYWRPDIIRSACAYSHGLVPAC